MDRSCYKEVCKVRTVQVFFWRASKVCGMLSGLTMQIRSRI